MGSEMCIRDSTNSALREATEYLYDNMPEALISATNPLRSGGVRMSRDLPTSPPSVAALGRLLTSFDSDCQRAILISGAPGPWRDRMGGLVQTIARRWPDAAVFIETPLGLLPYTLEDVSPWAHLMGSSSIWKDLSVEDRAFDLEALIGEVDHVVELSFENNKQTNLDLIESAFGEGVDEEISRAELDREMLEDKICYFLDVNRELAEEILADCTLSLIHI